MPERAIPNIVAPAPGDGVLCAYAQVKSSVRAYVPETSDERTRR